MPPTCGGRRYVPGGQGRDSHKCGLDNTKTVGTVSTTLRTRSACNPAVPCDAERARDEEMLRERNDGRCDCRERVTRPLPVRSYRRRCRRAPDERAGAPDTSATADARPVAKRSASTSKASQRAMRATAATDGQAGNGGGGQTEQQPIAGQKHDALGARKIWG